MTNNNIKEEISSKDNLQLSPIEKTVLVQARVWLINTQEKNIRNKLDQLSRFKESAYENFKNILNQIREEEKCIKEDLEKAKDDECTLRLQLDELSFIHSSISSPVIHSSITNRKEYLCQQLDQVLEQRNSISSQLSSIGKELFVLNRFSHEIFPNSNNSESFQNENEENNLLNIFQQDIDLSQIPTYINNSITRIQDIKKKETALREKLMVVLISRENSFLKQNPHPNDPIIIDDNDYSSFINILASLCKKIRNSGLVLDHQYCHRKIQRCFWGLDLVNYLLQAQIYSSQNNAIVFCQVLHKLGLIYSLPPYSTSLFVPSYKHLYRFRSDEKYVSTIIKYGRLDIIFSPPLPFSPNLDLSSLISSLSHSFYCRLDTEQLQLSCYTSEVHRHPLHVLDLIPTISIKCLDNNILEEKFDSNSNDPIDKDKIYLFEIVNNQNIVWWCITDSEKERSHWIRSIRSLHSPLNNTLICQASDNSPNQDQDLCPTASMQFRLSQAKYRLQWSNLFSFIHHHNEWLVSFRKNIINFFNLKKNESTLSQSNILVDLKELCFDIQSPLSEISYKFENFLKNCFQEARDHAFSYNMVQQQQSRLMLWQDQATDIASLSSLSTLSKSPKKYLLPLASPTNDEKSPRNNPFINVSTPSLIDDESFSILEDKQIVLEAVVESLAQCDNNAIIANWVEPKNTRVKTSTLSEFRTRNYCVKSEIVEPLLPNDSLNQKNTNSPASTSNSDSHFSSSQLNIILHHSSEDIQAFAIHLCHVLLGDLSDKLIHYQDNLQPLIVPIQDVIVENIITHLYSTLFPFYVERYQVTESKLHLRKEELKKYNIWQLGISPKLCLQNHNHDNNYQPAIDTLNKLPSYHSINDKLDCICQVAHTICHCIDHYYHQIQKTSDLIIEADDLLLIFGFIIIHSSVPSLWSELFFTEDYMLDAYRNTIRGYYLATLQAATELIQNFSLKDIVLRTDPFSKNIVSSPSNIPLESSNMDDDMEIFTPSSFI